MYNQGQISLISFSSLYSTGDQRLLRFHRERCERGLRNRDTRVTHACIIHMHTSVKCAGSTQVKVATTRGKNRSGQMAAIAFYDRCFV